MRQPLHTLRTLDAAAAFSGPRANGKLAHCTARIHDRPMPTKEVLSYRPRGGLVIRVALCEFCSKQAHRTIR
jgi:hypothetical protein